MGRIPEATINEIRDRIDIVTLIGKHITLKQAGSNWKGLCPFHDEKTPSFSVNPNEGFFYCFGCNESGDVFSFIEKRENKAFRDVVEQLAVELSIEIPDQAGAGGERSAPLFEANDHAQRFFAKNLASAEGAQALRYLEGRGFDAETARSFGLGFAPDRWDGLAGQLRSAGVSPEIALRAGLLAPPKQSGRSAYDRFRGRITFPIHDVHRRIIGFGGRALGKEQQPKYLNTPETPVFLKRKVFYGLPQALEAVRKTSRIIVSEGYFDRIALERAGLSESVATCGTALGTDHAEELRRRRVGEVILLFDGDRAGYKALERGLEVLLPKGLRVRGVSLPAGHDPDSFRREAGDDALRDLVEGAPDALEVVTQNVLARGCATPAEKADAAQVLANFVILVQNPVERDEHARLVAMALGADPESIQALVRGARRKSRSDPTPSVREAPRVEPAAADREQHHLARIVGLVVREPSLVQSPLRSKVEEELPEGAWKTLLACLFDAADAGKLDADGRFDLFAIQEQLDSDLKERLNRIVVDPMPVSEERSAEAEMLEVLEWFEKKRLGREARNLTRQLEDPSSDPETVLLEKQRLMEERLASQRPASRGTA